MTPQELSKIIIEADLHKESIREMYVSKKWILPDALKFKHPNEISDLFLIILIRMLEDDEVIDNKEYSNMTMEIRGQICAIMMNDVYLEMGPEELF
jgi:hypothetical protein